MRAVPYEVPYRRPIQTAHGTLTDRKGFWVLVEDQGHVGLGEVAPLPEWGTERLEDAAQALASCPSIPLPSDLSDLPAFLSALGLDREQLPATSAGVELACLDLMARRHGVTLAALLALPGHSPLVSLPLNALLTAAEPEALSAEATQRVLEGFRTLKLKLAQGEIAQDLARVQAVRAAVGPDVRLRGDANAGWDPEAAALALKRLLPFDLEYLEQPVAEAAALAPLREIGVPVAADESAMDPVAIRRLIAERAVDWLILKPMALGGVLYTRDLALEAREAGIGVTLTSVLDRGVGTAAALHLTAALGLETAAGLSNTHLAAQDFVGHVPVKGRLTVMGPGHGVSLSALKGEVTHGV